MLGKSAVVAVSLTLAAATGSPSQARATGEAEALASHVQSLRAERDALIEHLKVLERRAKQAAAEIPLNADGCTDPSLWLKPGGVAQRGAAAAMDQPFSQEATAAEGAKRVFVHYSTREPGALQLARAVAVKLSESGFIVPELRSVAIAIERSSVRYFFQADQTASAAVKEVVTSVLGADTELRAPRVLDMRHYAPKPRNNTLELWVTAASS